MKLKRIILAVAVALSLLITSCGKEPEQKHLEYENAVATFVRAFNKGDEKTLLNCFTPAVREEFSQSGERAVSLLESSTKQSCGEFIALSYTLIDKTELSEKDIEAISSDYNSRFGKRLSIKKAYSLDVTFSVTTVSSAKPISTDMTVITAKTDDGWCIIGDIITQIF